MINILEGDCRDLLPYIPDGSVNCCVTSPPYWGLRDYGHLGQIGLENTPEEYTGKLVDIFAEVRRVLRDDGTLWLNLGDSYARDPKKKGSGTPTGRNNRGENYTGQKGLGGLKPKNLVGIPWRVAFALQAYGWYIRADIIWEKPNAMPESVKDRPTRSHEYIFLLSKSRRYFYDADAIRENPAGYKRKGGTANYTAGGSATHGIGSRSLYQMSNKGRNKRSVWPVPTRPFPEAHFAVFPEKLIEPCILAGCPSGGIVLDPFAGSGTTGIVAEKLGRESILIEANSEYVGIAQARIKTEGGRS